jgi:TonB family protein
MWEYLTMTTRKSMGILNSALALLVLAAAPAVAQGQETDSASGVTVQLQSQTQGTDFKPYLTRVVAELKRRWLEHRPLGIDQGHLTLQFAINRDGTVTKVVVAESSGREVLDRAGVAAIAQANPLPQLPAGFKSDQIVLKANFVYRPEKPRQ